MLVSEALYRNSIRSLVFLVEFNEAESVGAARSSHLVTSLMKRAATAARGVCRCVITAGRANSQTAGMFSHVKSSAESHFQIVLKLI